MNIQIKAQDAKATRPLAGKVSPDTSGSGLPAHARGRIGGGTQWLWGRYRGCIDHGHRSAGRRRLDRTLNRERNEFEPRANI